MKRVGNKANNKGFTLIELLVVIAIIGILSSVVLASLNTARQKSRDVKRISDLKQIQLALEFSFDANNEYPDTIAIADLVTPGYISTIPVDPDGSNYFYDNITTANAACVVATGVCTKYHLGANLEDVGHTVLDSDVDNVGTESAVVEGVDADGCGDEVGFYCYDLIP
jgi:prepilin-type N-terminal cleavage/methylation domain-containing protein